MTNALSSEAIGVTANTTVVGIGPSLAFSGTEAYRFTIVGIPTGFADQQTLEQLAGASSALTITFAILFQLFLHHIKQGGRYDSRDRDMNPLITADIVD